MAWDSALPLMGLGAEELVMARAWGLMGKQGSRHQALEGLGLDAWLQGELAMAAWVSGAVP